MNPKPAILESIANADFFMRKACQRIGVLSTNMERKSEKSIIRSKGWEYTSRRQRALVSTVIMTVTLAKVAQVDEIAVVTPPDSNGKVSFQLLAASESWVLPRFTGWGVLKRSPPWPLGLSPFQPSTKSSDRATLT